ncbi:unnamed protein product [Diatraea saccharalis]|uniref:Uncharacterized protein n=1 Tax=Diatraea saccharalis TaxID=40085 RepID=A0A9N9R904_9NEOP|nr:unnamed protein product [Diatraea saccharalis]
MEVAEEQEIYKKCYQLGLQLFDSLNIYYNVSNSLIVLWNKFQIFVYEDLNFENSSKIFTPEFQVDQLILSNNYLICLDSSGNVHTTSLKFKNPAQKRFKSSFLPRSQGVLLLNAQIQDSIISIKHENDHYYLYLNKINSDFQLENKMQLKYDGRWPLPAPMQNKCLLTSYRLTTTELNYIMKIFNCKETNMSDCHLLVLSFDKLTLYACLFNQKRGVNSANLVKLYTCPSEICNIEVVDNNGLNIYIGLKIGTFIRLFLNNVLRKPDIIHLNTALHKYATIKDTIIYTDGRSMWKTENLFDENISFTRCFVRQVKDFVRFGDQIICTSYTTMLYIFPMDDHNSFLKQETTEEYCSAEKLINNSEYLYKIMEEVEKNNELTKKINNEGNYITTLSMSKRQDVMDNILQHTVKVYESYEDVTKENSDIKLTENLFEYFKPNSFYFLITLTTGSMQHVLNNILSNILNKVKIHITLSTDLKLLKTTSVEMVETFKKLKVLLPFDNKDDNVTEIILNLKLVSSIPGAFDERQKLWATLFRKCVVLKSEHFIKPNIAIKSCLILKEQPEPLSDTIYKLAVDQYGSLFNITDISKYHSNSKQFSVYGRLPNDYENIFKDESLLNRLEYLTKKKATYVLEQIRSEEFLKSKSNICFQVGNTNVTIEIINDDFTNPLLQVTSMNMLIAFNIRNFITNLIYNEAAMGTGYGNIKHVLYNTTENTLREIKLALLNQCNHEEFQPLTDKFQKDVIGALPI